MASESVFTAYLAIVTRSSAEKVVVYCIIFPACSCSPTAVQCIGYKLVHLLQHIGRQSCFFGCGKLVGGLKIAAKAHG